MVDRKHNAGAGSSDPSKIIASLNSLSVGKMDVIRSKLDEARHACLALDRADLAEKLGQASSALGRAEMKTYRKRVESVIAQLGHLR